MAPTAAAARLLLIAAALAVSTADASACSTSEVSAVETLASELQQLYSGQLMVDSAPADVPSSCVAAFQSTETDFESLLCATDCISWLQVVLARDSCASEAMEDALATTATVVAKCQTRRLRFDNARQYDREDVRPLTEAGRNMRGLAATAEREEALVDSEDAELTDKRRAERKLSIKGLMDAILVLTLNQGL
jgi:hypothetical protein